MLTFLGTLTVALLLFTLNDINDGVDSLGERIDRVEVSLGERIDRLEARVDAGFAAQGAHIVETDRKLIALIAHLKRDGGGRRRARRQTLGWDELGLARA